MDTQEILFQKTLVDTITHITSVTHVTPINDVAIITISDNLSVVPLNITMSGPIPYKSNKSIPWNYGGEIFYHGIKQIESVEEGSNEEIRWEN